MKNIILLIILIFFSLNGNLYMKHLDKQIKKYKKYYNSKKNKKD